MKLHSSILLTALALGLTSLVTFAEDAPKPGGPAAAGEGAGHRPVGPIMAALDANHDGIIDAAEIANASAALKALDKNGDGQLSGDEIHPPHGPGGPGGDKGERRGKGKGAPDGAAPEGDKAK